MCRFQIHPPSPPKHTATLPSPSFTSCHRKYSQSEYRKQFCVRRCCNSYFLGIHTRLNIKARMYTIQVIMTRRMFHGIQLETRKRCITFCRRRKATCQNTHTHTSFSPLHRTQKWPKYILGPSRRYDCKHDTVTEYNVIQDG